MTADDPGLAARLFKLGLSKSDAGNVALARALILEKHLKAVLVRHAGGGPVVISEEELEKADQMKLIDQSEVIDGQPVMRFELSELQGNQ